MFSSFYLCAFLALLFPNYLLYLSLSLLLCLSLSLSLFISLSASPCFFVAPSARYIYEPWKAPKEVQKAAGCIIGKDYPKPIVDHTIVSKANMNKIKTAYDEHKRREAESRCVYSHA